MGPATFPFLCVDVEPDPPSKQPKATSLGYRGPTSSIEPYLVHLFLCFSHSGANPGGLSKPL